MMEHEKSYVYAPERPTKRRRVDDGAGLDASLPLREKLYRELWTTQKERIDDVIKSANETTLEEVSTFLRDSKHDRIRDELPSGFLLAGPSVAAHSFLFEQLEERSRDEPGTIFIKVSSSDALNLKTLLKAVIKIGTSQKAADDDDVDLLPLRKSGRKLLDYDLQLLHEWVKDNRIQQVVVALLDCEAFDSGVLSEAIELFSIWSNRIPFSLLFGVATSIENMQDRLSQKASRCLVGQQFDVVQSEQILEEIFAATTIRGDHRLRLGPQLSNMILQRHHENLLSTQDFVCSLQYAYMSHFHANPLSMFLHEDFYKPSKERKGLLSGMNHEHFEALRNAPSFRKLVEDNLENPQSMKALLGDDEKLLEQIQGSLSELQNKLNIISDVVQIIATLQRLLLGGAAPSSTLYTKALSDALNDSPAIRELLLAVKKAPSDVLAQVIKATIEVCQNTYQEDKFSDIQVLSAQLDELLSDSEISQPLRSAHDIAADTLRTTVVAQKVQLSRHKAKLSEKDEAYSKIVNSFHDILRSLLDCPHVSGLFGIEILVYDLRTPHRAALTPKPRFAIERALSAPHDYLNCQCCGAGAKAGEDSTISASLPPTALLYRLYLESGALINTTDLFSAFAAVMDYESDEDKAKAMPTFQRALAELKYLGFVKTTRKKTDHIVKVAWKGL